MKVGDLVKVVQGGKLIPPWIGKTGIIIEKSVWAARTGKADTFTVMVGRERLDMDVSYLEKIDEDR